MVVNLRRLALSAAVATAVGLPLFVRPPESPVESWSVMDTLERLSSRAWRAGQTYTALAERESVLEWLAATDRSRSAPLAFSRLAADGRLPAAQAELDRLWKLFTPDPKARVALIAYDVGAYPPVGFRAYSGAMMVERNGSSWCVALVPVRSRRGPPPVVGTVVTRNAIAPCLLVARFGPPGPTLRQWLETTRYHAARSGEWLLRPRDWIDGRGSPPWERQFEPWWFDPSRLLRGFGARSIAAPRGPPYQLGAPAVRCLAGDESACLAIVFDTAALASHNRWLPRDMTMGGWRPLEGSTFVESRPVAPWLLSDLIRDQGQDRFERFWRSERPIHEAFRDAFDTEPGAWVYRWARRQWEASPDAEYAKRFTLGTRLPAAVVLTTALWVGVVLALAGWRAQRRTIG